MTAGGKYFPKSDLLMILIQKMALDHFELFYAKLNFMKMPRSLETNYVNWKQLQNKTFNNLSK